MAATNVQAFSGDVTIAGAATVTGGITADISGNITGGVTGNADTATALQNPRNINGTAFDGTADISILPFIDNNETGQASVYPVFTTDSTAGYKSLYEDSGLVYDTTNNKLTTTTFSGALEGNADTATTLATARSINGVSFDGSANITVEPYISDDNTGDTQCFITFTLNGTAGYKRLYEDENLQWNNTNNILYASTVSSANFYLDGALYHDGNTTTYMAFETEYIRFQSYPGNSGDDRTRMYIYSGGSVRIDRNHQINPYINSNFSSGNSAWYLYRYSNNWAMRHYSNNYLDFDWNGGTKAYIRHDRGTALINFTGQHRSFVYNVKPQQITDHEGLIVSANKNTYHDISENLVTGKRAITINEALPLVSLSNVAYDKSCFGVISGSEDPNGNNREYQQGNIVSVYKKELGDTRAHINSLGEGSVWVCNINGNLESGDYITTSNVTGYGMKQDDDILHNYTVAKITMDCDFNPRVQPLKRVLKEVRDVQYWIKREPFKTTYEKYLELDEDSRTTETETYYTKLSTSTLSGYPEELDEIEYNGLPNTVKPNYESNTRTIYKEIVMTRRETEEEGFVLENINEPANVLNEHGELQWEDDPDGATETAYEIRYLTSDGTQTDEANAVYKAAFVGCTYHCG
jgi:hypothetical protein